MSTTTHQDTGRQGTKGVIAASKPSLTDGGAFEYRPLGDADVPAFAQMLFDSFNDWHRKHRDGGDRFVCPPQDLAIYYQIYNDLTPGCSIAAFESATGQIVGSCFYHPRPSHVALGIMSVHPDFGGRGIGRALTERILRITRERGCPSCRLVGSAGNMDSFSLYNRAGFVPRAVYQDMAINVAERHAPLRPAGWDCVREAAPGDVAAMGALEWEVGGIRRELDYRYAIENSRGVLHAAVYQGERGGIDGFLISIRHPALNMLGPCVARSQEAALALLAGELPRFAGARVLLAVPVDKSIMVAQCYAWGARNIDMHLCQVWGEFRSFNGVSMPSFLPETG